MFEIPQNVVAGVVGEASGDGVLQTVQYGSFSSEPTIVDLASYDPTTKTIIVSQKAGVDMRGTTPCAQVLPYRAPVFADYRGDNFVRVQHSTAVCGNPRKPEWKNILVQKDVQLPKNVSLQSLEEGVRSGRQD